MRPPAEFITIPGEFWKILKLCYGLVESERQWKITIESRLLHEYKMDTVPGLPPFFYEVDDFNKTSLIIDKVVDDFLLSGEIFELHRFKTAIKNRFQVERYTTDANFVFYRLHISQKHNYDVEVCISEYMGTVKPMKYLEKEERNTTNLLQNKIKRTTWSYRKVKLYWTWLLASCSIHSQLRPAKNNKPHSSCFERSERYSEITGTIYTKNSIPHPCPLSTFIIHLRFLTFPHQQYH